MKKKGFRWSFIQFSTNNINYSNYVFRENIISKFVNSETVKEFTSECKTKNELNFKAEDEEYFSCELVINDEKLYLQKEIMIIKLQTSMKQYLKRMKLKIKCNNLKDESIRDESIKEDIDESEYVNGYKYEDLGNGKGQFLIQHIIKGLKLIQTSLIRMIWLKTYGEYSYSKIVKDKIFFLLGEIQEK